MTSRTTEPTCTESGKSVYTATVTFDGTDYTDTKEKEIAATGHTYRYTDNGDDTHTKECTFGDDMTTELHTYQNGTCIYCGAEEPEEHTHEYGEPEFSWSEDYKSCTVVFTCFLASNFPHFHRYDSLKSALYIHAVSKNINTFQKSRTHSRRYRG